MDNRRVTDTKKITLSGILLSFAVISLFLATVVPTNTLSFYALSSFFVAIIVLQFGIKSGWIFYLASSALSFILLPDKAGLVPYLAFFGLYGIIKFYIERLNKIVLEYILKLAFFNSALFLALMLVKQFLLEHVNVNFPWWIIILVFEIAFIAYDYVYTLFIQFYNTKLKRKLGM